MKKKIFFGFVGGLLAMLSILSVDTSLSNTGDISLKKIAVMALAQAEDKTYPSKVNGNGCAFDGIWLEGYLVP
jgi:hypothetical protein